MLPTHTLETLSPMAIPQAINGRQLLCGRFTSPAWGLMVWCRERDQLASAITVTQESLRFLTEERLSFFARDVEEPRHTGAGHAIG